MYVLCGDVNPTQGKFDSKERECDSIGRGNVTPEGKEMWEEEIVSKKREWDSRMKGNVTLAGWGMYLQNRGNVIGD